MQIITDIIITVIIVFGPRLMVLLCNKVKLLGMLGPIFLCYALGIILGIVFNGLSLDNSVASVFSDANQSLLFFYPRLSLQLPLNFQHSPPWF